MAIREITTAECDICTRKIDTEETYIDAMSYGAAFHLKCWQNTPMTMKQVCRILEIDTIRVILSNGEHHKAIHAT